MKRGRYTSTWPTGIGVLRASWNWWCDMADKIKKGNAVEFTRDYRQNYTMGTGEYGIAVEDERSDHSVTVELKDGSTYRARHIHAYAWMGWIPEELEDAQMRHSPPDDYDF
jgi:hypothetical protein